MRSNDAAAEALQELADLIAISGGDPYRVRSYEKAARSVAGYPLDLDTLDRKGLMAIRRSVRTPPTSCSSSVKPAASPLWRNCTPSCPRVCALSWGSPDSDPSGPTRSMWSWAFRRCRNY